VCSRALLARASTRPRSSDDRERHFQDGQRREHLRAARGSCRQYEHVSGPGYRRSVKGDVTRYWPYRGRLQTPITLVMIFGLAVSVLFPHSYLYFAIDAVLLLFFVSQFRARIELAPTGVTAYRLVRRRLRLPWNDVEKFDFYDKEVMLRRVDGRLDRLTLGKTRRGGLLFSRVLNAEMTRLRTGGSEG